LLLYHDHLTVVVVVVVVVGAVDLLMTDVIPTRRRRHSGTNHPPHHVLSQRFLDSDMTPPPRPKSTPAHERPLQRRRQHGPGSDSDSNSEQQQQQQQQLDKIRLSSSSSSSSLSPPPPVVTIIKNVAVSPSTPLRERPTRPLPRKMSNQISNGAPNRNPVPRPSNPAMLPVQAHVPRGGAASTQRRLFVVLEQACLEAYRVTSGVKGKGGRGEADVKYTLLNCDDHQGILAKTGRDIADARPDITHQVASCLILRSDFIDLILHHLSVFSPF
jgi:rRNA small subunit pseudouridine methyltransferase Nep1